MITITGLALDPLLHVIGNMREIDRREVDACSPGEPAMHRARRIRDATTHGALFWFDGEPVAACGSAPIRSGVVALWALGTDAWPRVVMAMTRWLCRDMAPLLIAHGVHRVQCLSLSERMDTYKWVRRMGARQEAVIPGFGSRGENFTLYAWTAADGTLHRFSQRRGGASRGGTGARPRDQLHDGDAGASGRSDASAASVLL
jgi:hypothetical protein